MRIIKTNGKSVYLHFQSSAPAGPPPVGETGALVNTFVAGQTLGGQRLVVIIAGEVFYFNPADETHYDRTVGFTKTAATIGTNVDVIMSGIVTGMSLTLGSVYYASTTGLITTTVPTTGIQLRVGTAKSSTVLALKFSQPIILV